MLEMWSYSLCSALRRAQEDGQLKVHAISTFVLSGCYRLWLIDVRENRYEHHIDWYLLYSSLIDSSNMVVEQTLSSKNAIFWIVTSCSPADFRRRCGEIYCPHLQRRKISISNSKQMILVAVCFMLVDWLAYSSIAKWSSTFLQNVCEVVPNDTDLLSRRYYF